MEAKPCEEYEESLDWFRGMQSLCAVCNQPEADHPEFQSDKAEEKERQ